MRTMKYAIIVLSLATVTAAALPVARAEDDPAKKEALALYGEGLALADQARVDHDTRGYEAALRKFLTAYSLVRRPNILFSVAVTEKNLGRAVDAIRDLRRFVREADADSRQVEQAKKFMTELAPQVARLRVDAPSGAAILVDGMSMGQTAPLSDPIDLSPGRHAIQAVAGDKNAQQSVDLTAGQTTNLDLEFLVVTPMQPASPPAASAGISLPPPVATETISAPVTPASSSGARMIASVAMGVLGVAGIGTGVGFLIGANDADSSVQSLQPEQLTCPQPPVTATCQELADALHSRTDDTNLGRGLVAGGVVLLGAGLVTWLLWPNSSSGSVAVVPATIGKDAGAWMVGSF
jgi:hypothetical protein